MKNPGHLNRHIARFAGRVVAVSGALALALALTSAPALAHGSHNRHNPHVKHHKKHHKSKHYDHGHSTSRHRHHRYDYGHYGTHHRGHGDPYTRDHRHHRYDRFEIPRVIVAARFDHYRPYYEGSIYYSPHRHRHSVYHFPVATSHGYRLRPHHYCDGQLFTGGHVSYRGRNVSFSVGF